MTPQAIVAIAQVIIGIFVSFVLEVNPDSKLSKWWNALKYKALFLLGLMLLIGLVWWALFCFTPIEVPAVELPCGLNGAVQALAFGFLGWMSTQTTFTTGTRKLPNAVIRNGGS